MIFDSEYKGWATEYYLQVLCEQLGRLNDNIEKVISKTIRPDSGINLGVLLDDAERERKSRESAGDSSDS